jgi:hypothetical protein
MMPMVFIFAALKKYNASACGFDEALLCDLAQPACSDI